MKQTKSLEQCPPVLRGQCIDCFREYSDRATTLLLPGDSRASPERDRWRWMPCSGLQYSTECFFLTGGLLLHRRKHVRGLRSQNVHDLQSFQSKSVNKYNSVSLHLDLLSSASVFRQTPRTHTLLCLEITFSQSWMFLATWGRWSWEGCRRGQWHWWLAPDVPRPVHKSICIPSSHWKP